MRSTALGRRYFMTLTAVAILSSALFADGPKSTDQDSKHEKTFITSKSTGMKLVQIPAGTFQMGCSDADVQALSGKNPLPALMAKFEQPQHLVQISKPFFMGVFEVTQGEYKKVVRNNPSRFTEVEGKDTSHFPVEDISWFDAVWFCNQLSKAEGLSEYYTMQIFRKGRFRIEYANVTIANGNGYRLPTEAEWEYACRAGTTTPYHLGDALNWDIANVGGLHVDLENEGANLERTTKVGTYHEAVNNFGLYDMHGNVSEMCFDCFDSEAYAKRKGTPKDPFTINHRPERMVRGGSWSGYAFTARSAARSTIDSRSSSHTVGFRVVR